MKAHWQQALASAARQCYFLVTVALLAVLTLEVMPGADMRGTQRTGPSRQSDQSIAAALSFIVSAEDLAAPSRTNGRPAAEALDLIVSIDDLTPPNVSKRRTPTVSAATAGKAGVTERRLATMSTEVAGETEATRATPGFMSKDDVESQTATLTAASSPVPAASRRPPIAPRDQGWERIHVAKTLAETQRYDRFRSAAGSAQTAFGGETVLPPSHESLTFQVSQGYVQGADWGTDVIGSGSLSGFDVDFWSQTTMGPKGMEFQAGRFTLHSPGDRWSLEGGDIVSDIWGWARGTRISLRSSTWHAPRLSYYAKTERFGSYQNVFSYSDTLRATSWLSVGTELASDGSLIVRPRLRTSRFNLNPFYRVRPHEDLSRGIYGSIALWRRTTLYATYARMRTNETRESLIAGIRMPLARRVELNLERSSIHASKNRVGINSIGLSLPIGRVRVFARYQQRESMYLPSGEAAGGWQFTRQNEIFGGASYFAGSRFNIQYQTANRWRRDGGLDQQRQVSAFLRLSRKSFFDIISVLPDASTPAQNRVRFSYDLRQDLAFVAEYGNVSPYQGIEIDPEERRLKVMLRKRFTVNTPSAGRSVDGLIRDPLGQPLAGILVHLGQYATLSDKQGRYLFQHVPDGSYELRVDPRSLPPNYNLVEETRTIVVDRKFTEGIDWIALPLETIAGQVCTDDNSNEACDQGEGVEHVPVYLGDRVTATREDGHFAFHHVRPGRYSVRIDANNMPRGYVAGRRTDIETILEAGKPANPVWFIIRKWERPILYQELE